LALTFMGAGFLSMGLFFSGVTRNQIAAFILTFLGMMVLFALFFIRGQVGQGSAWFSVLGYVSFVEVWRSSIEGTVAPRLLLFHLSAAIFWLFLTTKVLEARKWS